MQAADDSRTETEFGGVGGCFFYTRIEAEVASGDWKSVLSNDCDKLELLVNGKKVPDKPEDSGVSVYS